MEEVTGQMGDGTSRPTGSGVATAGQAPIGASRSMVPWMALGTIGSAGMAVAGTRLGAVLQADRSTWWLSLPRAGHTLLTWAFYLSATVLVAAWIGLGRHARQGKLDVRRAWLILALWGTPLFLGPPLFSRDIYSYIGQGLLAHSGLNPYAFAPSALGQGSLLSSIAAAWRSTTSPYGPLFVGAARLTVGAGGSLTAQVFAFRALDLLGFGLIVGSLPRLARRHGADPGLALWLGALSPLALFSFIASGHNDGLMVGLMVAGTVVALEGRLFWGLVLCSLAATVKLPALAAVLFVALERYRSTSGPSRRVVVATSFAVPLATVTGVTLATGFGWSWLGPNALEVPTELRTLATPAVSLGVFFSHLLRLVGVPASQHGTVAVAQLVCGLGALAVVIALAWSVLTVPRLDVVRALGISLLVIVLGGPTLWPWYLMWGLVFLAATPAQRSKALAAMAALAMFVVGPSGHPLLGGNTFVLVSLGIALAALWLLRRRRWHSTVLGLTPRAS